jgi:hypothetical protein
MIHQNHADLADNQHDGPGEFTSEILFSADARGLTCAS